MRSELINTPSLHAILRNSGWLLADRCIRLVVGLLVGAWVARYLGPSQYGELAYVLTIIAFFQAIANMGLDGIVVRELTLSPQNAGSILGSAFRMRLFAGTACWILAILGMGLLKGWQHTDVWITALSGASLVFQAADTVDLWFQSQSQSKRTVVAKLLTYFVSSGIKIFLILTQAPLLAFAAVMALDVAMAAAGMAIAYRYFPSSTRWHHAPQQALRFIKESWPLVLSGLSIMIYMRIDQILIQEWLGKRELGIYAAVLPFATAWQFIPVTLSISIAPFLLRVRAEGEEKYLRALTNIFRLFSAIGWSICIFMALMSSFIVDLLLGPEYRASAQVLSIYVFTNIFIGLGVAQGLWLLNEGKTLTSLLNTMLGAATCIIGNYFLIPAMGLTGAAITAVLAQMVAATLSNLLLAPKIFALQVRGFFLIGYKG